MHIQPAQSTGPEICDLEKKLSEDIIESRPLPEPEALFKSLLAKVPTMGIFPSVGVWPRMIQFFQTSGVWPLIFVHRNLRFEPRVRSMYRMLIKNLGPHDIQIRDLTHRDPHGEKLWAKYVETQKEAENPHRIQQNIEPYLISNPLFFLSAFHGRNIVEPQRPTFLGSPEISGYGRALVPFSIQVRDPPPHVLGSLHFVPVHIFYHHIPLTKQNTKTVLKVVAFQLAQVMFATLSAREYREVIELHNRIQASERRARGVHAFLGGTPPDAESFFVNLITEVLTEPGLLFSNYFKRFDPEIQRFLNITFATMKIKHFSNTPITQSRGGGDLFGEPQRHRHSPEPPEREPPHKRQPKKGFLKRWLGL